MPSANAIGERTVGHELPQAGGSKTHDASLKRLLAGKLRWVEIDTFGYWLFFERRPIPNELFTVENLAEWMIRHYDAEEQADGEADL